MRMITKRTPWELRILISLIISLVPFNTGRVLLHRLLNGYHFSRSARIGFGTVLAVDKASIGNANVLRFNRFEGPFELTIEDGAIIGPSNQFTCLLTGIKKDQSGNPMYPNRHCKIGGNSHITERHYIDATGGFELGLGSWIAGCDSQFWTHGIKNEPIVIGNHCYVSSAVRFAPGAEIGDYVLVGLGSVVTGKFVQGNIMIGGVPAKVIRSIPKVNGPPSSNPSPGEGEAKGTLDGDSITP
jgi:acetyltransferase-like isoleucine patch superfamily enzyme